MERLSLSIKYETSFITQYCLRAIRSLPGMRPTRIMAVGSVASDECKYTKIKDQIYYLSDFDFVIALPLKDFVRYLKAFPKLSSMIQERLKRRNITAKVVFTPVPNILLKLTRFGMACRLVRCLQIAPIKLLSGDKTFRLASLSVSKLAILDILHTTIDEQLRIVSTFPLIDSAGQMSFMYTLAKGYINTFKAILWSKGACVKEYRRLWSYLDLDGVNADHDLVKAFLEFRDTLNLLALKSKLRCYGFDNLTETNMFRVWFKLREYLLQTWIQMVSELTEKVKKVDICEEKQVDARSLLTRTTTMFLSSHSLTSLFYDALVVAISLAFRSNLRVLATLLNVKALSDILMVLLYATPQGPDFFLGHLDELSQVYIKLCSNVVDNLSRKKTRTNQGALTPLENWYWLVSYGRQLRREVISSIIV